MRALGAVVLCLALAVPTGAAAIDLTHARDALRSAIASSDRVAAARMLGASGEASDVPALVLGLAGDADADVRAACAAALGQLGGSDAWAALSAATRDTSPLVQAAVAAALLTLRPRPITRPARCGEVFAAVFYRDRDIAICSDGSFEGRLHPRPVMHPLH